MLRRSAALLKLPLSMTSANKISLLAVSMNCPLVPKVKHIYAILMLFERHLGLYTGSSES